MMNPHMSRERVEQLRRREEKRYPAHLYGQYRVASQFNGYIVIIDGPRPQFVAGPFTTADEARTEARRLHAAE